MIRLPTGWRPFPVDQQHCFPPRRIPVSIEPESTSTTSISTRHIFHDIPLIPELETFCELPPTKRPPSAPVSSPARPRSSLGRYSKLGRSVPLTQNHITTSTRWRFCCFKLRRLYYQALSSAESRYSLLTHGQHATYKFNLLPTTNCSVLARPDHNISP